MPFTRRSVAGVIAVIAWAAAACSDPVATPSSQPVDLRYGKASTTGVTVKSTFPSAAPQNVTVDVQISGTGFDAGSSAQWLLNGAADPRVKTNSTQFVSSTSLIANLTIAADAVPTSYDVVVTTASGKKGIGTEAFTVLPMVELSAPAGTSRANDINESGLIVGTRGGGCSSGVLPVVWATDGSISDLPLPSPFCSGAAVRIDGSGDIVGIGGPSPSTVIRWIPGAGGYTAEILASFPGNFEVDGMNAAGHFVGSYLDPSTSRRKSVWWSAETGFVTLTNPGGLGSCYAGDVNNSDQIVGSCHGGTMQVTFWESPASVPEILPTLVGYNAGYLAEALNNNGIIAGYAGKTVHNQTVYTGVRWLRSGTQWTVENIGTLGGNNPVPTATNDLGWITGSDVSSGGTRHAFVWIPGTGMRDLGVNGVESYAYGINNPFDAAAIRIVGMSARQGNFRAVVWRP